MKPGLVHFTLREFHDLRGSRPLWVGMLATGAILGLIGPFGTDGFLATVPRLLYWIAITFITFSTGYCLSGGIIAWMRAAGRSPVLGIALGSAFAAGVIYCEVVAINLLVFGTVPRDLSGSGLGLPIFLIVLIVTLAIYVISAGAAKDVAAPPRLLDRLPVQVRGPLISLSVTDHYVHVTTARGTHMVLMRLSDAIAETAPTEGFQIHRSHWVARDAIQAVHRSTRKSEVVLTSGDRLPVSRTYQPQLKEAGFLPKSGS